METQEDLKQAEESNTPSMGKTALNFGFITGLAIIILNLVFYLTGSLPNSWFNNLSYLVLVGGIALSMKNFRDEVCGGFISYGRALGFGTLMVLIASVIYGLYSFLLFAYIDPDLTKVYLEKTEEQLIINNPDISDEELDMILAAYEQTLRPGFRLIGAIFSYTFMGFIFSLIISAFFKKKDPEAVEE